MSFKAIGALLALVYASIWAYQIWQRNLPEVIAAKAEARKVGELESARSWLKTSQWMLQQHNVECLNEGARLAQQVNDANRALERLER